MKKTCEYILTVSTVSQAAGEADNLSHRLSNARRRSISNRYLVVLLDRLLLICSSIPPYNAQIVEICGGCTKSQVPALGRVCSVVTVLRDPVAILKATPGEMQSLRRSEAERGSAGAICTAGLLASSFLRG